MALLLRRVCYCCEHDTIMAMTCVIVKVCLVHEQLLYLLLLLSLQCGAQCSEDANQASRLPPPMCSVAVCCSTLFRIAGL